MTLETSQPVALLEYLKAPKSFYTVFESTETHAVYKKPALVIGAERYDLPLGLFRVGRDPQNNLVVQDSALSRHHFAIDVQAHQAQLMDLGSANGTWVNKKRVRSAWLKDGDKIKVGDQTLSFEAPGFILSHAIFDESEGTHSKNLSKSSESYPWLFLLALLVASASLFMQLVNRERQILQDQALARMHQSIESALKNTSSSAPVSVPIEKPTSPLSPAKKWEKAVLDFRAGDEDQACASIKSLIPELKPQDLLRAKAKSFYERKCLL